MKQAGENLFRTIAIGESELNDTEAQCGRIFKCWSKPMENYWSVWEGRLVNVIRPCVCANCHLLKLDSYFPTEAGRVAGVYFCDYISKGWLHVLEKDISGGRRFTSQKGRERIYNWTFSKVNGLRKGRSGTYSQEETCLKLSHNERNIKAVLIRNHCHVF